MVKVSGLSMSPFLKDSDIVVVKENHLKTKIGNCYLKNGIIHRAIHPNGTCKGDRLLYEDSLSFGPKENYLVLGRITQKVPLKVSNYGHPSLEFISTIIAYLSRYNREKIIFRPFSLILIINLSKLHRFLEQFIILRTN